VGGEGGGDLGIGGIEFDELDPGALGDAVGDGFDGSADFFVGEGVGVGVDGAQGDGGEVGLVGLVFFDVEDQACSVGQIGDGGIVGDADGLGCGDAGGDGGVEIALLVADHP